MWTGAKPSMADELLQSRQQNEATVRNPEWRNYRRLEDFYAF